MSQLERDINETFEDIKGKIDNAPIIRLRGYLDQIHYMDQFTREQKQDLIMHGIERLYDNKRYKTMNFWLHPLESPGY